MGILKKHLDLYCKNKLEEKLLFEGKTLVIGQQAIYMKEMEAKKILQRNNINFTDNFALRNGKLTNVKEFKKNNLNLNINSEYLFKQLGSNQVDHLDVQREDDIEIECNLNEDVHEDLKNNYNNIIDMGSLEHISNLSKVLENYIKILKVNGFLVIETQSSNMIDHGYYSISPMFFFDFFELNGFKVINLYLREFNPYYHDYPDESSQIYHYKKKGLENCIVSGNSLETIVFLKKTSEVKKIKYPTQERYTFKETNNIKENLIRRFKNLIIKILKYFPLFIQKIIYRKIKMRNIKKL